MNNIPEKTSDCPSILIIRTCRKQNMTKATKKLLNQLRLQRVYQACLARLDQQMLNKLTILKECVVWGHVAPVTVRDLIMKRGRMGTISNAIERVLKSELNTHFTFILDFFINTFLLA